MAPTPSGAFFTLNNLGSDIAGWPLTIPRTWINASDEPATGFAVKLAPGIFANISASIPAGRCYRAVTRTF